MLHNVQVLNCLGACTVMSQLNKFEHVREGGAVPCTEDGGQDNIKGGMGPCVVGIPV